MNKFFRKNQKKMLAVFSILLMIVFVVTLGYRGPGNGGGAEVVIAHMGKTAITGTEMAEAKAEWAALMRTQVPTRMTPQPMPLPFVVLPPNVASDIQQHPEMYLLLRREAEDNGIRVGPDEANAIWVNDLHRPASSLSQTEVEAMRGILTIRAEVLQLGESVKVSDPSWRRTVATEFQGVRLNLVEFKAEDFDKLVPPPTPQQLQEQFEKYKNVATKAGATPSLMPEASSGLGFGYQVPARVKLQYITIPKAQIVASLQLTPEKQHEWEVKAAAYYLTHQSEYVNPPATQPATKPAEVFGPASGPATTAPATMAAAAPPVTQPAFKPFEQVSASIIETLMADDVKKQSDLVEKDIASQLSADWIAIRKADPSATQPASTQPAASQPAMAAAPTTAPLMQTAAALEPLAQSSVPIHQIDVTTTQPTFARLEQIRADVQARLHVSVEIHGMNAWQSLPQLGALPGIGSAQTADRDPFNAYALSFTGQPSVISAALLQAWEPSQALTDSADNTYVFRLTAAQAAHAPEDMTPLIPQLGADLRVAQTYDLAKQAAQKLLVSAKTLGLAQATRTSGQTVISTGQFSPRVGARMIPNYPLTDSAAQADLGAAAQKLLAGATSADPRPDALAELPSIRRVLVIELAGVQLPFEIPLWEAQAETIREQREAATQSLTGDYFAYDAVIARTQYKAEQKS